MAEPQIRFDDGAGYERMMGKWSRLAGEVFLDWLKPPSGLRWIDVGCGNGAFTELLAERCAPAEIQGVDPSEAQLAFARARHSADIAQFRQGDAMALSFADNSFDAAAMALVIFFVPEPPAGVAEMARVVRPGGRVVVLELTTPERPPLSWFYGLWFDRLVPLLGRAAGDVEAYSYLPSSVRRFPGARGLAAAMTAVGLVRVRWILTAGGIIAIHHGEVEA
jgi:ubiquinone/menaquinone biosynthesis methyltransferase